MDADEALARALQQEEMMKAKTGGRDKMIEQLQGCMDKVTRCEDELLHALALSVCPLDALNAEANDALALNAALGEPMQLAQEDLLAQALLRWFKTAFMTWTDQPPCHQCGSADTQLSGTQPPTDEERKHAASRTEVYACGVCNALTRFPRYNDPAKLLETRTGRCGEWANCFLLFLRAAGLTARYVLDVTDHVWCEYHSRQLARWVHLDPCEAAFDKPLLYEGGWGKKLSYVFGVDTSGFTDIVRRYTRKFASDVAQRRTAVTEEEMAQVLARLNDRVRHGLPRDVLDAIQVRELAEQLELMQCATSTPNAEELAALPGRTTGSLQWRTERGETGAASSTGHAPPTAYASARDTSLPPPFKAFGRICGGAVRASGENAPGECAAAAFDGSADTKFLDFGAAGIGGTSWLEYRLLVDMPPTVVAAYDVVSANDCPERDPANWVLEGACAPGPGSTDVTWVLMDERRGVVFGSRGELRAFMVPRRQRRAVTRVRLRVTQTRTPKDANSLQLAALGLYRDAAVADSATAAVPSDAAPEECAIAFAGAAAAAASAERDAPADDAAAGGGGSSGNGDVELTEKAVAVVTTLMSNIVASPGDARFRRVRASKLPACLLASPPACRLLMATGFRPLMMRDTPVAARGDTFLVHAAGEEHEAAAARALEELRRRT